MGIFQDAPALTRRSFVAVAGAATAGAFVFGYLGDFSGGKDQGVEVYNWVVIAPDNIVTLRIAQMEMGQGALTTMAQLLAEELEANFSVIRTEYFSATTNLKRGGVYGRIVTAGSEGVAQSERPLRIAGAQIRTMLLQAAAEKADAAIADFAARNSVVTQLSTGRKFTFGELAAAAALRPVPDPGSIVLKKPDAWTLIGKSVDRLDIPSKTRGTAIFGIDVTLPGMKHAAITMCPVFGGSLRSFNGAEAITLPGVRKIVPLDGAVAVIADSWWQAKTAVDAIKVQWDEGEGNVDRQREHPIFAPCGLGA